ncbi:vacuolar protein sorting-associated protein IST1-like [Andrographis paniculata]|uniref:vacuolar protein sorting-associated protein IST1-like n=1 Tax=Andrographis paniculata TaxID=175694 RepID=UPI0021E780D3|nr:vacuolar protein sorting-associated protein IST1-like [Andrographis paniculata]
MKMFQGLLKSRFYSKCKSDLKVTRTRIEIIKKRKNAIQKYFKNDIVDLLRNGFDLNAYDRVEGLIHEIEKSSCYEFIDRYCQHISDNLSAIDKQRECPNDCREAVSSLMYAAARFADLPELRQLRTLFSERYGRSLDPYVEKQFAEKANAEMPSKDVKLRLLEEIASESGLDWSPKPLQNKLFNKTNEFNNRDAELPPVKDISVDIVGAFADAKDEGRDDDRKPLMYRSNRPPYTKPRNGGDELCEKARRAVKSVRTRGRDSLLDQTSSSESDEKDKARQSSRALSLPPDKSSGAAETSPTHVRSVSCEANVHVGGGHVHPRLPDYDDVVARLGSIRGKSSR